MAFDHQVFTRFLRASCIALAMPLSALANPALMLPPPGASLDMGGECTFMAFHPVATELRDAPPPPAPTPELSEAQQDAIFNLNHRLAPLVREQARIARAARQALDSAMTAPDVDEERIRELVTMAMQAEGEIEVLQRIATRHARDILTDAQREFLAQRLQPERMPPPHRGRGPAFESQ